MNKLTQEKYDLTCSLMKAGIDVHSGNEHLIFAAVDAYAAAQVAAKDAEIAALKKDAQHSRQIEQAQVDEIATLKADKVALELANKLSSSGWRKDCEERDNRISELLAENEQMKEGIQRLKRKMNPFWRKVLNAIYDGN